jgi:hypothetical protein
MGSLIKNLLDKIIVENIFPYICKILPLNDKVALFLNLHLCNKAWQTMVDMRGLGDLVCACY